MTVTVVVPTLDEAATVGAALASVARQTPPWRVVVADGGSSDGTPELVRAAWPEAVVVTGPPGRGRQLADGAALADGEALLFLHADTRLADGALDAVRAALAGDGVAGGCFRTTFDTPAHGFGPLGRAAMRLWQARMWMRWHRLAFGDRAIFCTRAAFDAAGGMPDSPLFEDLELVRRLRRVGRFVFLPLDVVTSARRFRRHGAVRQQARNLALWLAWNAGVAPERLARHYPRHGDETRRATEQVPGTSRSRSGDSG